MRTRAPSIALSVLSALAASGCRSEQGSGHGAGHDADPAKAAPSSSPISERPAALERGIAWLERAPAPIAADTLVGLQIVSDLTGDPRARNVANSRRRDLDKDDERYARLLHVAKPALSHGLLDGATPSPAAPVLKVPTASTDDGRSWVAGCVSSAIQCDTGDRCRGFVEARGRSGYVLTHQGLWLIIWGWMGCEGPVDVATRRREIASELLAQAKADPGFSDLAVERLAILGHLGFGHAIDRERVRVILDAERAEGCWPVEPGRECDQHPTTLSLWALAHARHAGTWTD